MHDRRSTLRRPDERLAEERTVLKALPLVGAAAIGNTFRFQVRMLSGRSTYGAGVKRDPADHLCVAGELLPAQPVGDRWAIRGELVELSR
jgi:hypothetical protein